MPYKAYSYYLSHDPYNSDNNIHCPAGCSPVACAQLLYYLHYKIGIPEKAYGDCEDTYLNYPTDTTVVVSSSMLGLDSSTYSSSIWNQMSLTSSVANLGTKYVSILLAQMGMLMHTKYSINAGSTNVNMKYGMLAYEFGISLSQSSSFNFSTVRNQIINNELPLIISLNYVNNNGVTSNDHAAIIDACKYNNYLINKTYVVITPGIGGHYEYRVIQTPLIERFIGFNWGYSGNDMMSSGSVKWYNADVISWIGGGNDFNHVVQVLYGFH